VAITAAAAVAERLLQRAGVKTGRWTQPAPYSIAVPWARDDEVFLAGAVDRPAHLLVADYAFLTHGFPFCLQPSARTAVVMHDLFSSRTGRFQKLGAADSVAVLEEEAEMRMLGSAEAILAIQPHEAGVVQQRLPEREVILAPMAVEPVSAPQPGRGRTLLFVGSNTAPNVLGLQWFIRDVWPLIRARAPDAELHVAGGVCHSVEGGTPGIRLLGFVSDLEAVYRDAAVVVSPLQVGSGLKIKLIEALGKGKAIVATTTTVEGVEDEVAGAVSVEDEAAGFAEAVLRLLTDDDLRNRRCRAALEAANRHFTAAACYRGLLHFAEAGPAPRGIADPAPPERRQAG
jgi:succinoglycan biosynthesis protein ExoO